MGMPGNCSLGAAIWKGLVCGWRRNRHRLLYAPGPERARCLPGGAKSRAVKPLENQTIVPMVVGDGDAETARSPM